MATRADLNAQGSAVKIKPADIGGVVASTRGPEAGVWVIAESTDLPTPYIKEVVTDDRGRYLIPICHRPAIACGLAAMASSTDPKSRPGRERSSI
jgi:hypothetical protein